jgi:hypothetical protein
MVLHAYYPKYSGVRGKESCFEAREDKVSTRPFLENKLKAKDWGHGWVLKKYSN